MIIPVTAADLAAGRFAGPPSPTTTVLSLRGRAGNLQGLPEDAVYIGRAARRGGWNLTASALANPWRIGPDGDAESVLALVEQHVLASPVLRELVTLVRGRVLLCWCDPPNPCHGRVIARLADRMPDEPAVSVAAKARS